MKFQVLSNSRGRRRGTGTGEGEGELLNGNAELWKALAKPKNTQELRFLPSPILHRYSAMISLKMRSSGKWDLMDPGNHPRGSRLGGDSRRGCWETSPRTTPSTRPPTNTACNEIPGASLSPPSQA